jgi:hypothetical protein
MSTRYDEKQKFFTDVTPKEATPVLVQTLTHRIRGKFHIHPGKRLLDEINISGQFNAITNARIFDHTGKELYRCSFMALNRNQIIWIIPEDELQMKEGS